MILTKKHLLVVVNLFFLCTCAYSNVDLEIKNSSDLIDANKYAEALNVLDKLNAKEIVEKQKPLILHKKAECCWNLNQKEKAFNYFKEIVNKYKAYDDIKAIYISLSEYCMLSNNIVEAKRYLNSILEEFPDDKYYHYLAKSNLVELKAYEGHVSVEIYSSIISELEGLIKDASKQKINLKGIIDYLLKRKAFYAGLLGSGKTIEKEYYPNGSLKYERTYNRSVQEGVTRLYYETGELKEESNYKDGSEDGVQTRYYKNGKMNLYYIAKKGKKDGVYKTFYDDGSIKVEGVSVGGKEEGLFLEHSKSGQIIKEATWKNGKLDGKYVLRKGFLVFEFSFNNGKLEIIPLIPGIIIGLLVLGIAIYALKRITTNKARN